MTRDRFQQVIDKFLVPISEFEGPVMDSTYFFHRNGSFVFSEGYCHPPGAFWGMIIKYPLPGGHIDLFGRSYGWTHREYIDGELRMIPDARQLENQFRVVPGLKEIQGEKPVFARHVARFPLSDFQGCFDAARSMRILRKDYPWIDEAVQKTCRLLDWDPERTGVTGSLSYGLVEDDIDMVFIGSPEENAAVAARIRRYLADNPEGRVVELGKEWPIRFHYADTLICPFFRYAEPAQIPLLSFRMSVEEEGVEFEGTVGDDTHNLYLPVLVRLTEIRRGDGQPEADRDLIVYHGAHRGELWRGDRVRLTGTIVSLTTPDAGARRAILVTDEKNLQRVAGSSR
ncbi:MAG: hypothetical protein P9M08_08875 [Candidatus Erginobacter occultus]|nr:hypothetical protein [Candidatus Erginobacter occultus]